MRREGDAMKFTWNRLIGASVIVGAAFFVCVLATSIAIEEFQVRQSYAVQMSVYTLISVSVGAWLHGEKVFEWLRIVIVKSAKIPDTKIGRVFFLVMVVGIALAAVGVVANISYWGITSIDWLFSNLWDLFFSGYAHRWHHYCARIGAVIAIFGYVLAYHYQKTIGRAVDWVRAGQDSESTATNGRINSPITNDRIICELVLTKEGGAVVALIKTTFELETIKHNAEQLREDVGAGVDSSRHWEVAVRMLLDSTKEGTLISGAQHSRDLCLSYLVAEVIKEIGYGDQCVISIGAAGEVAASIQRGNGLVRSLQIGSIPTIRG